MASFSETELLNALADGEWHSAAELAEGKVLREPGLAEYVRLLNELGRSIEQRDVRGRRQYRRAPRRTL